jgi:hypothetical protein
MQKERNAVGGIHSSRILAGKVRRAARIWLTVTALAGLIQACSASPAGSEGRYPEKKRPEPARSASDGEILGAQKQSPEETLEGSLTNEHAAPNPRDEREEKSAQPEPCVEPRPDGTLPATSPSGIPTQRRCPLKPTLEPAADEPR